MQQSAAAWALAETQHWVITRAQLLDLGFSRRAIEHRLETGRLRLVWRGVYAVGRRPLSRCGRWMAAVLACGPDAVLSHASAAELWRLQPAGAATIHVSAVASFEHRHPGIVFHRRRTLEARDVTVRDGIPVTTPVRTIIDMATGLRPDQLHAAINEADKRDLVDPDALRASLDDERGRPGVGVLRTALDRDTFTLTDSELERRFVPIALTAGLPLPETQRYVNGYRVDFYWPELGLIVETDGLRYHRTPSQQAKDRRRDQAHVEPDCWVDHTRAWSMQQSRWVRGRG